jgi:hypothetical protein
MTDPRLTDKGLAKTDTRLRAVLSSWRQRRRYRLQASTHHRSHPVRAASHANLNREFRGPRYIEWQWFLIPLLALTIIDFLYFQRWG